jgi:CheY-like chemotaxis protein
MTPVPGSPRVLFADDDPEMRDLIGLALRAGGFEVRAVGRGDELLAILESESPPAAVVSDVHMPGATGYDVLRWAARHVPSVPCIIVTAFGDPHTRRRLSILGAHAILTKPLDLEVLRRTVRDAIDQPLGRQATPIPHASLAKDSLAPAAKDTLQ